jgi:undecaprenyl-diphosphatase
MTLWEAALLGLLQGVTEFLPVSSSGHLVIGQHLLGIDLRHSGITFEVFVHFGTMLSIVTVYRKTIGKLIAQTYISLTHPNKLVDSYQTLPEFRFTVLILVSMIPTGLVYLLFKDHLERSFDHPKLVCCMLIATGGLLLASTIRKKTTGDINPIKSFFAGMAQSLAMIAGISRSGTTITCSILLNVDREKAANFSFLMSLPVVLGATALEVMELAKTDFKANLPYLLLGTIIAYASGVWAIHTVISLVKKGNLHYFAYYCFLIGIVGLLFI